LKHKIFKLNKEHNMNDLVEDVFKLKDELNASIKLLKTNGSKLAMAERDYKITLRTEALKLRENGMAIGLIDLIIYGVPDVAKLRFERDVADTIYKTNLEHINTTKLQLRVIENQIQREWGGKND